MSNIKYDENQFLDNIFIKNKFNRISSEKIKRNIKITSLESK